MKNKLSAVFLVIVAMATPVFSDTAEPATTADSRHAYFGIKGGPMTIGRDIPFNNDGVMLGALIGYDFPDNGFAIEGEFNTTVNKASSQDSRYSDLGVTTLAAYGVFRSPGRLFFKGKMGVAYEYLTASFTGAFPLDVDGAGMSISFGIGGGVRITERLIAEIEYTLIEEDIGYASLGVNWFFQ